MHARMHERWLSRGCIAFTVALGLFLVSNVMVLASSVNIYDQAGVLNQGQVQSEASRLAYPLNIYTADYAGSNSAFDQTARNKVNNDRLMVFAINTRGHVYMDGGRSVPLNSTQYTQASQAFANDYRNNHDFTSATVASVRSLGSMLGSTAGRGSSSNSGGLVAARGAGGFGSSVLCCIGLLALIAIATFVVVRRRSFPGRGMGGFFGNRSFNRPDDPYGAGYNQSNQPYNQPQGNYPPGNYPPGNYPPGYGPGYPQNQPRQGMNPWAAGGLGAAAGGLLGYGLGKEAGERDDQRDYGDQGGGADFGGDQGGYGGDQGGFGGGGDQGGGADFGGGGDQGGGADFGGGGDQGGGSNF